MHRQSQYTVRFVMEILGGSIDRSSLSSFGWTEKGLGFSQL